MNQTTATTTSTNAHPASDLEALRLQLKEDGKFYRCNPHSKEGREKLLDTLQNNDCREIITAVVDGGELANVFVIATYRGHVDVLEAFLHHGMNSNASDLSGETALMNASGGGREECVRLLFDHNASVDLQNRIGNTALMVAIQSGKTGIVEMLLEKNANVDFQDNFEGWTALMIASSYSNKQVVQLLLNHGADIDLKNYDGKTALDVAEVEEIKDILANHVSTSYVLK